MNNLNVGKYGLVEFAWTLDVGSRVGLTRMRDEHVGAQSRGSVDQTIYMNLEELFILTVGEKERERGVVAI